MKRVHKHGHVLDFGDVGVERSLARTRSMAELDTVLVGSVAQVNGGFQNVGRFHA